MKVFSIFDTQAKFFSKPVVYATRGEAISAFSALVNDEKKSSPHSQFPADYVLFEIGTFDDITGLLSSHQDSPYRLGSGLDFSRSKMSSPLRASPSDVMA